MIGAEIGGADAAVVVAATVAVAVVLAIAVALAVAAAAVEAPEAPEAAGAGEGDQWCTAATEVSGFPYSNSKYKKTGSINDTQRRAGSSQRQEQIQKRTTKSKQHSNTKQTTFHVSDEVHRLVASTQINRHVNHGPWQC